MKIISRRRLCFAIFVTLFLLMVNNAFSFTKIISASAKTRAPAAKRFEKIIRTTAKRPVAAGKRTPLTIISARVKHQVRVRRSRHRVAVFMRPRGISARSYLVMDNETGDVLLSRAPDRRAQPASTIKILTALIAINYLDDNDRVRPSRRAAAMPRSKIYLRPGATYRAGELIDAVLMSSANDASVALAEKIAGSERLFAKMMTYKAGIWGGSRTVCKTATGLTARGQYSTARDLVTIFNRAMDNPEFARRVARVRKRTSFGRTLRNHNRALWRIRGAEGGKTGFTNAARQTYVGTFGRGDGEITVAIMGSETMWDDISKLVRSGFTRMAARTKDHRIAGRGRVEVTPISFAATLGNPLLVSPSM